jgi:hypothetical protein
VKTGTRHSRRTRALIAIARTTKGTTIKQRIKPLDQIEHGTFWSYGHHGCRCAPCREANTTYCREYRARKSTESSALTGGKGR